MARVRRERFSPLRELADGGRSDLLVAASLTKLVNELEPANMRHIDRPKRASPN